MRVDLLPMDVACGPRHAIEYQGGAHYQGAARAWGEETWGRRG
jgi:hypothetical protein